MNTSLVIFDLVVDRFHSSARLCIRSMLLHGYLFSYVLIFCANELDSLNLYKG